MCSIISMWIGCANIPCLLLYVYLSVSCCVDFHPANMRTYILNIISVTLFTCLRCEVTCEIDIHLVPYLFLLHICICLYCVLLCTEFTTEFLGIICNIIQNEYQHMYIWKLQTGDRSFQMPITVYMAYETTLMYSVLWLLAYNQYSYVLCFMTASMQLV